MKSNSALKLKHLAWASAAVLVAVLLFLATRSGAKPVAQAPPPPVVEVAKVEQRDVRVSFKSQKRPYKPRKILSSSPSCVSLTVWVRG